MCGSNPRRSGGTARIYAYASDGGANRGQITHSLYEPATDAHAETTMVDNSWDFSDTNGRGFGAFDGVFYASNQSGGRVSITPSAANTPTSVTVTYSQLAGSTFDGIATPQTTVPGTAVTGVGMSSVGATSAIVWVTRTNTTITPVAWRVHGR